MTGRPEYCEEMPTSNSILCSPISVSNMLKIVGPHIAEVRSNPQRRKCIIKSSCSPPLYIRVLCKSTFPGLKLFFVVCHFSQNFCYRCSPLSAFSRFFYSEFWDSASYSATNQRPIHSLPEIPRTLPSMPNSASDLRLVEVRVSKGRWGSVSSAP
jgi:hypothetical protein